MFLRYVLIVLPVIFIVALAAGVYLKRSGRSDRRNNRILILCTAVSAAMALAVPLVAGVLLKALLLSVVSAIILAFVICSAVTAVCYTVLALLFKRNYVPSEAAIPQVVFDEAAAANESANQADDALLANQSDIGRNQQKIVDTARITDRIGVVETANFVALSSQVRETVTRMLNEAQIEKMHGRFTETIACYRTILSLKPDFELARLIIIDSCSISKKIGNPRIMHEFLDSEQGKLLDMEVKKEILSNI